MGVHGQARSDLRNLHLHRAALGKLRADAALRAPCLALVERWLALPAHAPSRPWLLEWRAMLADWPLERIERAVLAVEAGQTLRQCSPLGPALTPRERWAALAEVDHLLSRPASSNPSGE
jgi:hypothetical protein